MNISDLIKPGKAVKIFYGEGNPNNRICHIREIVDGYQIVFRVWSVEKQSWRYFVEPLCYFESITSHGYLSAAKYCA